jgi:hypothetical protein
MVLPSPERALGLPEQIPVDGGPHGGGGCSYRYLRPTLCGLASLPCWGECEARVCPTV